LHQIIGNFAIASPGHLGKVCRPTMPPLTESDLLENAESTSTTPLTAVELRSLVAQHGDRYEPILAVLRDQPWRELLTSRELLEALEAQGLDWSERTLRLYLAEMAEAGLIEREGRRGFRLGAAGAEVARELTVSRRLGSILYRMEETMCQVGADPTRGTGLVSVNAYVIPRRLLLPLLNDLEPVFAAGLAVGSRVLFARPGEDILGRPVPQDCIGLGTMCSLTIAGMLMRQGVPSHPLFGGLLAIRDGKPSHFLEMIRYDGTSLSPNEVFIRANLTSVAQAATTGAGAITASFREVPAPALGRLQAITRELDAAGFRGILHLGRPGQPVLNIPVHEGRVGMILATGLNPLASLWEKDHRIDSRPMVGPAPYESLITLDRFRQQAEALTA
jgi:repressor of nif and glnA expression